MSTQVEELVVRLRADATSLLAGLRKSQAETGKLGKTFRASQLAAGAALAGIGLEIKKSLNTYQEFGGSVRKLTDTTNISTEAASRLVGQWKRFGIEGSTGVNAFKFLAKNMDAATQGGKTQLEMFKRLGISLHDLKTQSGADIMAKARDAMSQMTDKTQRTAIMVKLFGRSGMDMLSWVKQAPGDIANVNKSLEKLGLVWGDKQLKTYKDLAKAQAENKLIWMGFQMQLAQSVVPIMQTVLEAFQKLLWAIQPLAPVLKYVAVGLAAFLIVGKLVAMIKAAAAAIKIAAAVQWLWNVALSANPIGLVVIAIAALVVALVLAYKKVGWFRDFVNACWRSIKEVTAAVWGAVKGAVTAAAGFIARDVTAKFTTLKKTLSAIWGAVKAGASIGWHAITGVIRDAVETIERYINAVIRAINIIPGVNIKPITVGNFVGPETKGTGPKRTAVGGGDAKRTAAGGGAKKTSLVGDVGSALSHVAGTAASAVGDVASMLGIKWPKLPGGLGIFADLPKWILEQAKKYIKKLMGGFLPGGKGNGAAVLAFAKRFLGVPYLWGGTSPEGFDCSGLVQYVYRHFGVGLPRVAADQQHAGRAVNPPYGLGDLLFFGNPAHHVGMYAGNNLMIDAPHTGAVVRIEGFNWPDFSGARRVIGAMLGGIFDGPRSGYPAVLHGREAVLPLDNPRRASQIAAKAGVAPAAAIEPLTVINHFHLPSGLVFGDLEAVAEAFAPAQMRAMNRIMARKARGTA